MRTLRFLCVATLIAAVAASVAVTLEVAASETQSAEERVYSVRRARTAPIIDGVVDDPAWEGVTVQVLDRDMKSGASWANAMDFAGEFRAVWREGSLYVAMEFEDDYVATDHDFFERSDRVVLRVRDAFSGEHRTYTVPVHAGQSLEDPSVPFATWSNDGRVCEFSVDTDAMGDGASRELSLNLSYVDVDQSGPDQEISWIADSPTRSQPQYGTFRFQRGLSADGLRGTSWGRMKSLY